MIIGRIMWSHLALNSNNVDIWNMFVALGSHSPRSQQQTASMQKPIYILRIYEVRVFGEEQEKEIHIRIFINSDKMASFVVYISNSIHKAHPQHNILDLLGTKLKMKHRKKMESLL